MLTMKPRSCENAPIAASRLFADQRSADGAPRRHEDLPPRLAAFGGVTFLKRACNDIALVGNTVLAFGDEPISLG
jgi:hypothetical protein